MPFYIIYPRGNKNKISVIELSIHCEYELRDYAVASRKTFYDEKSVNEYAKNLAKINNLIFESDEPDYLD
jgi:hypothetical protein